MKRTKDKWLNKKEWISFCSIHQEYQKDCDICNTGMWINVYWNKFDKLMWSLFPKLWLWYVNKNHYDKSCKSK